MAPADVAVDAGDAWFALLGSRCRGTVLASFRRALYVELGVDRSVLALVPLGDVPPGPIHLRVGTLSRFAPGTALTLTERALAVGEPVVRRVELDGLRRWRPPVLDAELLRRRASAARQSLPATRSALAGHPAITQAKWALHRGDRPGVVDALAGLGPGLTPAGDDVLGGLLVVLHAAGHDERALLDAVAGARTHAISHAFLAWAARGQAVEPVHLLLGALARGNLTDARRHQEAVLALGHTSGADLLFGLRVGLESDGCAWADDRAFEGMDGVAHGPTSCGGPAPSRGFNR